MKEGFTKAQIEEMVEACIKAIEKGEMLPREKREKFVGLLERIGKSKGIPWPK